MIFNPREADKRELDKEIYLVEELKRKQEADRQQYAGMLECKPEEVAFGEAEISDVTVVFVGTFIFTRMKDKEAPKNLRCIVGDAVLIGSRIQNLGALKVVAGNVFINTDERLNPDLTDLHIGGKLKRGIEDQYS